MCRAYGGTPVNLNIKSAGSRAYGGEWINVFCKAWNFKYISLLTEAFLCNATFVGSWHSLSVYSVGSKVKGVDLEAPGSINGVPVLEVDVESFEEKPWRKPGVYYHYEPVWSPFCGFCIWCLHSVCMYVCLQVRTCLTILTMVLMRTHGKRTVKSRRGYAWASTFSTLDPPLARSQ